MILKECVLRVRYKETDQMGIAYHSNYLVWFEVARSELFRAMGTPYSELEKNDLFLPVIKVMCEYKKPAYYDDELRVIIKLESMQDVRINFNYEIYRENNLICTGSTEHAFMNRNGKPLALKKHSPFLWKRLNSIVDEKD